jgi:hypothetical protein
MIHRSAAWEVGIGFARHEGRSRDLPLTRERIIATLSAGG